MVTFNYTWSNVSKFNPALVLLCEHIKTYTLFKYYILITYPPYYFMSDFLRKKYISYDPQQALLKSKVFIFIFISGSPKYFLKNA